MPGGASQTDTFDMKPNHENGGEFKEIATNVPGLRFSEHLPKLATQADKLAVIRSLSTAAPFTMIPKTAMYSMPWASVSAGLNN